MGQKLELAQGTAVLPADVAAVRKRIERWRETRQSGTPMPEELWGAAVRLVGVHGLYGVTRGLNVDYGALKKRVCQAEEGDADGAGSAADFVELEMAQASEPPAPCGAVVELSRADGARVVIRLAGGEALDVLGLAAGFLGRCA